MRSDARLRPDAVWSVSHEVLSTQVVSPLDSRSNHKIGLLSQDAIDQFLRQLDRR